MPNSIVFNFFKNFPISIGRTLLLRNPTIIIFIIINFAYYKSFEGIRSTIIIFLALTFVTLLIIFFLRRYLR